jgi:conjugative transfer signal peptidase TraF
MQEVQGRRPMKKLGTLAFAGVIMVVSVPSYRLNWTGSMPLGLWRADAADQTIRRGDVVLVCLPQEVSKLARERGYIGSGDCDGTAVLLKRVGAVSGDEVEVSPDGLSINGALIPNTSPVSSDPSGRAMPELHLGRQQVRPGTIWIVGRDRLSFDSRYFGPVPVDNVLALASPVIVD